MCLYNKYNKLPINKKDNSDLLKNIVIEINDDVLDNGNKSDPKVCIILLHITFLYFKYIMLFM